MFSNFKHFSLSVLKWNVGYQDLISQNVRIANREEPDQTASEEAVWSGSALFEYDFLSDKFCLKF